MNLPEAIQRQVDEAEALAAQLYAPQEGEQQQSEGSQSAETEVTSEGPSESTQQEPVKQPEIRAKPGKEEDPIYWRDRANALYGMNQQQAEELRQLRTAQQTMSDELMRLKQVSERQAEPTTPDNDAEVFGEDLMGAIDRRAEHKARELVAAQTKQLQEYIAKLESKLGTVGEQVAVSAQDKFYDQLASLVPDYESINVDPGFLNWLGESDPVYGVSRQAALDAGANALDAQRVANVFRAYAGTRAAPPKQDNRQELARQAAPTAARGSTQTSQGGKVYSQSEYVAAMDPRNIRTMGRQAAETLAADAERAYYEGRVRF